VVGGWPGGKGGSKSWARMAGMRSRVNFSAREIGLGGTPKHHLFYDRSMQLKCSNCAKDFELADSEILAAAGRIRSKLRRKHAGGRPTASLCLVRSGSVWSQRALPPPSRMPSVTRGKTGTRPMERHGYLVFGR
jgi:hypothetical protein